MTRKDYQKFADVFAQEVKDAQEFDDPILTYTAKRVVRRLVYEAAVIFAQDNQRFDVKKFYTACGLEVF